MVVNVVLEACIFQRLSEPMGSNQAIMPRKSGPINRRLRCRIHYPLMYAKDEDGWRSSIEEQRIYLGLSEKIMKKKGYDTTPRDLTKLYPSGFDSGPH